jgi:hypothetical protein
MFSLRYLHGPSTTGHPDTSEKEERPMTVRLQDAATAAHGRGVTYYAFPNVAETGQDDLVVVIVQPDEGLGWRLTLLEGRYDGSLAATRTGHPDRRARRHMANLVFHPSSAIDGMDGMPAVEAVRRLEGYEDDVRLHPHAARTVVNARRDEDRRVPISRPSPFCSLQQASALVGAALCLANVLAVLAMAASRGGPAAGPRHFALSTTVVTLAVLCASTLVLSRMSSASRLFVNAAARERSRTATVRLGQFVILLAVLSAINGLSAVS